MSTSSPNDEIRNYIEASRFALLTYVRDDSAPVTRAMGSFAAAGFDLYFSTSRDAAKVRQIANSPRVSFFFEHPHQPLGEWKNVLLIGDAAEVTDAREQAEAVARLSARNLRFRERVARGELAHTAIFRVRTREIEYLDRTKGHGYVQKIVL